MSRPSLFVLCLALASSVPVYAQGTGASPTAPPAPAAAQQDLAAQLANPIASLISVPLQNNWDFGLGQTDALRYTLNIQPVIPFTLNDRWNLITRTIVPVVSGNSPAPGVSGATGLGDIVQSFFFSPRAPVGGWVVGAGPALLYATGTDDFVGAGKWAAGPTAVLLQQKGPWTYGSLVNHLASYAGDDARADVNATFVNPFVSYITTTKTTFTVSPELTYDWERDQWIAPINLVMSQLLLAGRQPFSAAVGVRFYAESPTGGPAWGIRFGFTALFPK
jgi:hypothetical protein